LCDGADEIPKRLDPLSRMIAAIDIAYSFRPNQGESMSEVTSVNGHTGVVVLTAADVEAVPTSAEGKPSGVATLDGSGVLHEAQLPTSVVSSSLTLLGEVEGNVTPNLSEGRVFAMTAKGNVTIKKPTGWPPGAIYAELVITQDATGGRTITLEGVVWENGTAPAFTTTPNAVNRIPIGSDDGGTTWYAVGPQVGPTGATGPEGFSPSKLLLPSEVLMYKEPGTGITETKAAIAESFIRSQATNTLVLTSGTPVFAAIPVPAGKVISGIGVAVTATEGTPANRTHLWGAILNTASTVLKRTVDFTSSVNTVMNTGHVRGLKLESTYETTEASIIVAAICEVMSSTNPITIGTREGMAVPSEVPLLGGTLNAGQTTPGGLPSPATPTATVKVPYMVLL
jgi:hypothetical protein